LDSGSLSSTRPEAVTAISSAALLKIAGAELDRYHRLAESARAGLGGWRARLRTTAYVLYRYLEEDDRRRHRLLVELRSSGERPAQLIGAEIEAFTDLIDEGRALPTAPPSLTRVTAESLGGGIFNQLCLAARRGPMPPEEQLVPKLMYTAVLPYLGATGAAEELRIPPPPAGYSPGHGGEAE
jgi:AcrR family transcriptional regulator